METYVNNNRTVIEVMEGMIFFIEDRFPNTKTGNINRHFYLALGEPAESGFVQCFSITSGQNRDVSGRWYIPITVIEGERSYINVSELHAIAKSQFTNRNYRAIIKKFDIMPRNDFLKFAFNMFLHINNLPTSVEDYILEMLYDEYIEAYNKKYADNLDRANPIISLSADSVENRQITQKPFEDLSKIIDEVDNTEEEEVEVERAPLSKAKERAKQTRPIKRTKTKKKRSEARSNDVFIIPSGLPKNWSDDEILEYLILKECKTMEEMMSIFGYKKSTIYTLNWRVHKEGVERKLIAADE